MDKRLVAFAATRMMNMAEFVDDVAQFNLAPSAYRRVCLQSLALAGLYLLCAALGLSGGLLLYPTYMHGFTWYLKWQDALVASCFCFALLSLGGLLLTGRFLFALYRGYTRGMIIMDGADRLTGRDLSPKNFASIFWALAPTFTCFVLMLIALCPTFLLALTPYFANPVLVFFSTIVALLLSLCGVAASIPCGIFFVIGLVGAFSLCRNLGASQEYTLHSQTILRLDGFVLAVLHPEKAEALFDLQLLSARDQQLLLTLLHKRWTSASEPLWNPTLGQEIEAALKEAGSETLAV